MWTNSPRDRIYHNEPAAFRHDTLVREIDETREDLKSAQSDEKPILQQKHNKLDKYPSYISSTIDSYPY